MKIETNRPEGLYRIMGELRWWVHAITAVPMIFLVASLVPGDKVNGNVLGTVVLITVVAIFNAVITVPLTLGRRKIVASVLPSEEPDVRSESGSW